MKNSHARPIDMQATTEDLKKCVSKLQRRYDAFNKIVPILKKYEGKTITKHIVETALDAAYPGGFYLREIEGMTYIGFRGETPQSYGDCEEFFLCYHSDPIYREKLLTDRHNYGMREVSRSLLYWGYCLIETYEKGSNVGSRKRTRKSSYKTA